MMYSARLVIASTAWSALTIWGSGALSTCVASSSWRPGVGGILSSSFGVKAEAGRAHLPANPPRQKPGEALTICEMIVC